MVKLEKYETQIIPYKSTFFSVSICECILALLLIISAFTMKFFFPKSFSAAKEWYNKNAKVDTNVSEFIKEVTDENTTVRH